MESFTCSKFPSCYSLAIIITLLYFCTTTTCLPTRLLVQQSPVKSNPSSTEFIKTSCRVTLYPDLCYNTLSSYASTIQTNPAELANAALSVSLNEAKSTSALVLKLSKGLELRPREAGAVKDCVENTRDSVDELQQSLQAMKDLKGPEFEFKINDLQTWVSAALTNEDTCMDNFEGNGMNGKVKDTIRGRIVRVSQLISNALALINQLNQ